jgi:hypothetical protein
MTQETRFGACGVFSGATVGSTRYSIDKRYSIEQQESKRPQSVSLSRRAVAQTVSKLWGDWICI